MFIPVAIEDLSLSLHTWDATVAKNDGDDMKKDFRSLQFNLKDDRAISITNDIWIGKT